MSLLVISEILELLVNSITTIENYSLRNSENLPQLIQMQLSKKQKKFSGFPVAFIKIYIKFWTF